MAEAARNVACTGAVPARHHRLPQLRQPGEARGLLPVPRGVPRHRRRLPRVRHAGHRRQRLASTTRARPARSTRHPPSAWSACSSASTRRVPSHFTAPGDEILVLGATAGAARRLRLLGRGPRLHRRRAAAGRPRRRARGSSDFLVAAAARRPAPLGARLLRGRPGGGPRGGCDRRALRRAGLRRRGRPPAYAPALADAGAALRRGRRAGGRLCRAGARSQRSWRCCAASTVCRLLSARAR